MAMEALQRQPLMEIKSQQHKMLGAERTAASVQAQLSGRNLSEIPVVEDGSSKGFVKCSLRVGETVGLYCT